MIKKNSSGPTITVVQPRTPFQPALGAKLQPAGMPARKMAAKDVAASLGALAEGWNPGIEKLLNMPPELHMMRDESSGATYYSLEPDFPIIDFLKSLRGKPARPRTGYGIAVYETASTTYLVLADSGRMMAARVPLSNLHDTTIRKDWASVADAINGAVSAAGAHPGKVAFYDGAISLL
jgi:hypothetical protein